MNIEKFSKLKEKFKLRNIKVRYFETLEDAKLCTLNIIPSSCTIGIGHSVILQRIDTTNSLLERENIVYDKELAKDKFDMINKA